MKILVRNLLIFSALIFSSDLFAQQAFRPFGASKTISMPGTVPTATPFNSFLVNPALYQPTSFGSLDCQYYTYFQSLSPWSEGDRGAIGGCQSFAQNYNMPAPSANPLETQLGEVESLTPADADGFITRPDIAPQLYNPYAGISSYINTVTSGPTGDSCPTGPSGDYIDEDAYPPVDSSRALTAEERERLFGDLGDQPDWKPSSEGLNLKELPEPENMDEEREAGYYRYNDGDGHVYLNERVEWNLRAVGRVLAEKKMTMGVGEMSSATGSTPGHTEHQTGRDIDLRLMDHTADDGTVEGARCTVHDSSCYSRENTFEMVKAFIDVDPYGIDSVFINDPQLQTMINNYLSDTYGIDRNERGRQISRSCAGHANHIHLSFKDGGTDPDDLARRANN